MIVFISKPMRQCQEIPADSPIISDPLYFSSRKESSNGDPALGVNVPEEHQDASIAFVLREIV